MQAVICSQHGTPDKLEVKEWPDRKPAAGEVKISVRACGVNFPDVLMIAGRYQVQPDLPFIPGAEFAGEVAELGKGVSGLTVGQRVLAMCGNGAFAESVCIDAKLVMPIPDAMDYATAAGFTLTYSTSWHALKQRGKLREGETLLVLGAAGGVGLTAVELGALTGARVIAAASSAEKLELAGQYGATDFINYSDDKLSDRVKELTDGNGADVIYDPVGGDLFDDCLRAVAWNGRILVIGFAAGTIQNIPANLPLLKGSSVVGVFWGRFAQMEPAAQAGNTRELLQFFAEGKIRPHVSERFALADAAAAISHLAERRAKGKVIIEI